MAVLTWRNVNAPSGAGLQALQAANDTTTQGIDMINASLDRFREGRSDLAEAELAQRMLGITDYDQLQQARQSGSLSEGINSSHLTPAALGRINEQSDSLLRRNIQQEGLNQSRTTFKNQQDDRTSEQAATPAIAQLFEAAANGDRGAIQRIYAEHGDSISNLPLDRLQSVSSGAMDLEQGRAGINNQQHSQQIASGRLRLAARRVANAEANTAYNREQTALQTQQNDLLAQARNALLLGSNDADDAMANYTTIVNSEAGAQFTPQMLNGLLKDIEDNFPGATGSREVDEAALDNVSHPVLSLINNSVNENTNAIAQSGAPTYVDDLSTARSAPRTSPIEVSQGLAERTGLDVTDVQRELRRILREPGVDGNANVAGVILEHSIGNADPSALDYAAYVSPAAYLARELWGGDDEIGFNQNAIDSGVNYLSNQGQNSNFSVAERVNTNTQTLRGLEQDLRQEVVKLQEAQRRAEANPGLSNSVTRQQNRVDRISERIQEAIERADADRTRIRSTR